METVDNQKKMDESSASVVATEPTSTTDPSLTSAAPVEADHPLSKAWSAVHHAVGLVASFDAFTALVSEAEALKDLTNIRAALSALVTAFPLCWGYWTRWARHERQATAAAVAEGGEEAAAKEARKRARDVLQQGTEQAEQVHELWTAYVSELITGLQHGDVEVEEVRSAFVKGAVVLSLDPASSAFWDKYVEFETSQSPTPPVAAPTSTSSSTPRSYLGEVYYRLLTQPLKDIERFYSHFLRYSTTASLSDLYNNEEEAKMKSDQAVSGSENLNMSAEEKEVWEVTQRKIILSSRESIYLTSKSHRDERSPFESKIQRPYFHTAALDASELTNWNEYISDLIKKKASRDEVKKVMERALIAAAMYGEVWERYVSYLAENDEEDQQGEEKKEEKDEKKEEEEESKRRDETLALVTRATGLFMKDNVSFHLHSASALELFVSPTSDSSAVIDTIRQLYERVHTELVPLSVAAWMQRVGFEKRAEKLEEKVIAIFQRALKAVDENHIAKPLPSSTSDPSSATSGSSIKTPESAFLSVEYLTLQYAKYLSFHQNRAASNEETIRQLYETVAEKIAPTKKAVATGDGTEEQKEGASEMDTATTTNGNHSSSTTSSATAARFAPSKHHTLFWLAYISWEANIDLSTTSSSSVDRVSALYERAFTSSTGAFSIASQHTLWSAYVAFVEEKSTTWKEIRRLQQRYAKWSEQNPLATTVVGQGGGGAGEKRKRKPVESDNPFEQKRGRGSYSGAAYPPAPAPTGYGAAYGAPQQYAAPVAAGAYYPQPPAYGAYPPQQQQYY